MQNLLEISKKEYERSRLYNIFSENFHSIKKETFIQIEPDIPNSYICPLCTKCLSNIELDQTRDNCLTLEDVPPKKLGGKPITLTCKKCNNTAGSLLDEELRKKLISDEFFEGIPGAIVDAKIRLSKDLFISGTLSHRKSGGLSVHLFKNGPNANEKKSHCIEKAREHLENNGLRKVDFNLKMYRKCRPEVALLRIAYLLAFSTFGYGFLFNPNLELIREQIKKPSENILPSFGVINDDFSNTEPGIYIIVEPKELWSFLVIFELKTSNRTTKHGVILPGPSEPGIDIYKLPQQKHKFSGETIQYHAIQIPKINYLHDHSLKFVPTILWDKLVSGRDIYKTAKHNQL